MKPSERLLVSLILVAMTATPAWADVAPDPVETTGLAAIAIAAVAVVILAGALVVRRLRSRGSARQQ